MRIIIDGAGGIGGVIGAQLFQGGVETILIARGDHFRAIQNQGLLYRTPHGDTTLPIQAVDHPSKIDFRPDDAVILTMKSQHTEVALDDLRATAGDEIPVFCCQNGVDNERMAARRFRQQGKVQSRLIVDGRNTHQTNHRQSKLLAASNYEAVCVPR